MRKYLTGILMAALVVVLLASVASVASARAYTTSKPVLSNAPKKDRPFTASGYITPKSTSSRTRPPSRRSCG